MRKSATPPLCVLRGKLKKHNRNAKNNKIYLHDILNNKAVYDHSIIKWLNKRDIKSSSRRVYEKKINLPNNFSIFDEPEKCFKFILK